ncbi:MAG: PaaI family thioesterase [Kiritimatiellae bacterium]|nr:PaaI family thioesterase [Kiritimatiellia bacterium]
MGLFNSLEQARAYFSQDKFATENGIILDEVGPDRAVASMMIGPRHKNAWGGVMGGAIFTLADFAFAALTNDEKHVTVAQQVSINYLSQPKGKKLIAKAQYRKDGRSSAVAIVDIVDELGKEVAIFTALGFKLDARK